MRTITPRQKLIGLLLFLVGGLLLTVWLLDFSSHMSATYSIQIWLPIIISMSIGALGMHIYMMDEAVPVVATSATEVASEVTKKQAAMGATHSTTLEDDSNVIFV